MQTMRYTLQDFTNITFEGFEIKLPDETMSMITDLAVQVGSPTYIRTPIFSKREHNITSSDSNVDNNFKKKKRGNRSNEMVNDDDWESIRSFQATEIVQKVGIDAQIDVIRSCLNKMSDKNYNEQSAKIVEVLTNVTQHNIDPLDVSRIGKAIFEIASNNRFYSKLYADLYSDLIDKFEIMSVIFETNLNAFLELFTQIEHCSADENYDKFCKINKDNEKRKALSSFIVNLTLNKIIKKDKLIELTFNLLNQVTTLIKQDNKKNEVDEMSENIAILYNKELFNGCEQKIDDKNFMETITIFAHSKVKSYASLSNKSIFKFMDMIEM